MVPSSDSLPAQHSKARGIWLSARGPRSMWSHHKGNCIWIAIVSMYKALPMRSAALICPTTVFAPSALVVSNILLFPTVLLSYNFKRRKFDEAFKKTIEEAAVNGLFICSHRRKDDSAPCRKQFKSMKSLQAHVDRGVHDYQKQSKLFSIKQSLNQSKLFS